MSSLNSLELGLNRASVIQFKTEVLQSVCSARSQVNNESTERGKYSTVMIERGYLRYFLLVIYFLLMTPKILTPSNYYALNVSLEPCICT